MFPILPGALDGTTLLLRAYRLLARRREPDFELAPVSRADRRHPLALARPLHRAAVGLVTTAGVFVRAHDTAFAVCDPGGDPSFRRIPLDAPADSLSLAPGRFDPRAAERDLECVLPRRALRALAEKGTVLRAVEPALSFHGHVSRTDALRDATAPAAARILVDAGADAAVVVAACPLGAQTAALIAGALERAGVSAVVLTAWGAPARRACAPRVLTVRRPFGAPLGPPGDGAAQEATLLAAVRRLESL